MLKKVLEYVTKSCYSIFRIEKSKGVSQMNGILDARTLACYIINQYNIFTNHTKEISNIKLQKALYFLLAYWGGFIRKGKLNNSEEIIDVNEFLFSNEVQAWVYGPVVPDVYYAQRDGTLKNYEEDLSEVFNSIPMLEETINSLLTDIFSVADFKLVSTSHEDKTWLDHFKMESQFHNEIMPQEDIISEYALRDAI